MDFSNAPIDINSYVAKYMDEMGCSFEQACEDLELEQSNVFARHSNEEIH